MATRTAYILQDALRLLGDPGEKVFKRKQLLRILDQVQDELCREAYAKKFEATLALAAGQEVYDIDGICWKVRSIREPETWATKLTVVKVASKWAEVRRTTYNATQPLYLYSIDKFAHLWPLPTEDDEELTLECYGLPEATMLETTDPELDQAWDKALLYGLVADANPNLKDGAGMTYEQKYENKKMETSQLMRDETVAGPRQMESPTGDLYF